ncbi:MAG: GMC family oxidoreductase N-terminal domain-containing protein [Steroidobacteraceae bacterium]
MKSQFDYIVVGSGSAGAAVAARLSEDPAIRVLLLEAGPPDRHPFQLMPLAFPKVAWGSIGTWQYKTEPEPHLHGRQLDYPRGRTLGGTSSINAMIAIRGHRRDYDRWAESGLAGWRYADVLPYFKRLETSWRGAGPYHGAQGPVRISRMEGADLLWEPLLESARAAGVPYCDDANGAEQDGISRMEATVGGGLRSSTARAYLYPARQRANLVIETDALTHRLDIANGRAVGVRYQQRGQMREAQAEREIIVCGGAINTPQLLLLSGIGPPDELRALGIQPVHALPGVGRNLVDHPNILNEYELKGGQGLTRHLRVDRAALAVLRWNLTHGGPFALTGTSANVFARTLPGLDQPDIQMMMLPISNNAELWGPGLARKPPFRLAVRTGYLQPKSRGWVKLRSANPVDAPRILLNLFDDPRDLDAMVRAVQLSRSIYSQSPLRELIRAEALPGPGTDDEAALKEHIRRNGGHRSHPVGTCRMGHDALAVVDERLCVRGLDGLRIADTSVMPDVPSGNTNLPAIMVGERAADLIRGRSLPPEAVR